MSPGHRTDQGAILSLHQVALVNHYVGKSVFLLLLLHQELPLTLQCDDLQPLPDQHSLGVSLLPHLHGLSVSSSALVTEARLSQCRRWCHH